MTIREAFDDILLLFSVENADQAFDFIRKNALRCLNAALQIAQLSPKLDHYSRQSINVVTTAGNNDYALSKDIQTVIGPVTISGIPLRKLSTLGDYNLFPSLYMGSVGALSDARPVAYYVHPTRDTANTGGDNVSMRILFSPTPDAVYTCKVYVKKEAARFTLADLCDEDILVPAPHGYAETCILPIARWAATKGRYFTEKDRIPIYQTDYLAALAALDLSNPKVIERALERALDLGSEERNARGAKAA